MLAEVLDRCYLFRAVYSRPSWQYHLRMSASDEWQDRHLTPHGWVDGSYRVDGSGVTHVDVPPDRLLTVRHSEYSGWGANIVRSDGEHYRAPGQDEQIAFLLAKFGDAPKSL